MRTQKLSRRNPWRAANQKAHSVSSCPTLTFLVAREVEKRRFACDNATESISTKDRGHVDEERELFRLEFCSLQCAGRAFLN